MEKAYRNISFFFLAILIIVILGFFKTYFGLFPTFKNVTNIQHIHGALFLLWFIMLIVQPILVRKRQYKWHRLVGKVSYFLVPLIVFSIFFIAKEMYDNSPTNLPQSARISSLYIPFYQIVDFVTLYILAIYYKRKISYHMRYMITTSLAVYGAALKRFFIHMLGVNGQNAFLYTYILTDLILIGLIVYDIRHGKLYKPYIVSLILIFLSQLGFYFLRDTVIWQTVCGKFVQLFY
jgi:hypothetical protein